MKFPRGIRRKLDKLEKKIRLVDRLNRQAKKQKSNFELEIAKIRSENADELYLAASVTANWIQEFFSSKQGKRLLAVSLGGLKLFCQPYIGGRPSFGSEKTTFATIELGTDGSVYYKERYKFFPSSDTFLDNCPINPMVLVENLHPDYLVDLAEHLSSGGVWEYIGSFLPKGD